MLLDRDHQAAAKKIQAGLENHLQDLKHDEATKTKGGATVVTGTGKGKKKGVDVVFAAAIFDAGNGQLVGAAFVVDRGTPAGTFLRGRRDAGTPGRDRACDLRDRERRRRRSVTRRPVRACVRRRTQEPTNRSYNRTSVRICER